MVYASHVYPSNLVDQYTSQLTQVGSVGQGGPTGSGGHVVPIDNQMPGCVREELPRRA